MISPTTETKLISKSPNDDNTDEEDIIISPKTSFESSDSIILVLSPDKVERIFPFIVLFKVQIKYGLSLKLIFTPIKQVNSLPFNFKLSIEATLDEVFPVISDFKDIPTFLPTTETRLIVILPKEEYIVLFDIDISLKVSPSELNIATPLNWHFFPPIILLVVQVKSVPSSIKLIFSFNKHFKI